MKKELNISEYDKMLLLRNCVNSKSSLYIFKMAFKDKQKTLVEKI